MYNRLIYVYYNFYLVMSGYTNRIKNRKLEVYNLIH